jgi:hypothetical protein
MNVTGSRYKLQALVRERWQTMHQSDDAAALVHRLVAEQRRRQTTPLRVLDSTTDAVLAWTGAQAEAPPAASRELDVQRGEERPQEPQTEAQHHDHLNHDLDRRVQRNVGRHQIENDPDDHQHDHD